MDKPLLRISVLFVLSILLSIQGMISLERQLKNPEFSKSVDLDTNFGKIPIYFIPNEGQVNEKALFYARASKYTLWLTNEGLLFDSTRRAKKGTDDSITYDRYVSSLLFVNVNGSVEIIPVDQNEHKVNHFIGNDRAKWRTNIQTSRAVIYRELYPHIDLKVYGIEKQIEYDFVVKPGGEISDIAFEYKDVEKTKIDKDGNLVAEAEFGRLEHAKPVCYQVIGQERVEVKAKFREIEKNTYGFIVEEYNKEYTLVIDPLVLVYSTYLGGDGADEVRCIALDSAGGVYMTGRMFSSDFPTKNPIQGNHAGGTTDIFITKINASGSALVYSTYLGGSDNDTGSDIVVDSDGAAYLTGFTISPDFPAKGPFQGSLSGISDAFVAKLNASGNALVYSTYLGGSDKDYGIGIAVDSDGEAYVTGNTDSVDFPTLNPAQGSCGGGDGDVFIAKLNALGSALVYATYLGGSDSDDTIGIAVDSDGAAYVTGNTDSADFPTYNPIQGINLGDSDVFIAKVNASGTALVYSTYLGGSKDDGCSGIVVDSAGAVYVAGTTGSLDFPIQKPLQGTNAGLHDAFIAKLNASGTAFAYSTYLGGSENDGCSGVAVDSAGAVYVAGTTGSLDFPAQKPLQESNSGMNDIFITKVNVSGTELTYSTYLGGSDNDYGEGIAVDSESAVYVSGVTLSTDFPTKNPIQGSCAGDEDIFIAKLGYSDIISYSLTITAGSGGTTNPSPGSYAYDEGMEVTVTAMPDSGYKFGGWSGDLTSTSNPIIISMDANKSITANFTQEQSGDGGSDGGGNCFIATACYGSPIAEEVQILSAFRDWYLITKPTGRVLVEVYYKHSPKFADFIRDKEILKSVVRECLKPFIKIVREVLN